MATVGDNAPVDVSGGASRQVQTQLEHARYLLAQPVQGVPLTKYLQWFAKKSQVPAEHVEKHPQFWDSTYMRMFLAEEHMGTDGMASLMQKLQNMAAAQANADTAEDELHDDDDMPEFVRDGE